MAFFRGYPSPLTAGDEHNKQKDEKNNGDKPPVFNTPHNYLQFGR
jgi:hypothetical protein